MKRKIALLLITGICLANTVPCFASPSMKVSVSSSEENQYSTLPDGDTLQKDVGFRPKAPASLAGGYLFGSGNITESFDLDSNGAPVNKQKGISFKYIKNSRIICSPRRKKGIPETPQSRINTMFLRLCPFLWLRYKNLF